MNAHQSDSPQKWKFSFRMNKTLSKLDWDMKALIEMNILPILTNVIWMPAKVMGSNWTRQRVNWITPETSGRYFGTFIWNALSVQNRTYGAHSKREIFFSLLIVSVPNKHGVTIRLTNCTRQNCSCYESFQYAPNHFLHELEKKMRERKGRDTRISEGLNLLLLFFVFVIRLSDDRSAGSLSLIL
jgi:hypothetical protein